MGVLINIKTVQMPIISTGLIFRTVSGGVAPLLYVLAMSEFRHQVEEKLEDIWQFVTNKFTSIVRGFRVQPEVEEPIDNSLVIHRTVFVQNQSETGSLSNRLLPNQPASSN